MAIARVFKMTDKPKLFDHVIQGVQDGIAELSWMNHIFGRAERLVKMVEGRRYYSPNVYAGKEEYILLTPDNTELGNYCFFVMEEPQMVSLPMGVTNRIRSPFSLIVWVDMRKVGEQKDIRDTEAVKEAILKAVRRSWIKKGSVTLERIYERAENVFNGFSLDEVDNQFLMAPFWGMRVTGEMVVDEDCDTL
jgi:hypothetical protein